MASFSDPVVRRAADRRLIARGHLGTAYQATNALYTGRSDPVIYHQFPHATLLHPRLLVKYRVGAPSTAASSERRSATAPRPHAG